MRRRTEFKQVELLCLDLIGTPYVSDASMQNILEEQIAYRYLSIRSKVKRAEHRLRLINQIIQEKNPSLLAQLVKHSK